MSGHYEDAFHRMARRARTNDYDDDTDERPDELTPLECHYCGRVMTYREAVEQGACNDCYANQGGYQ